MRKVSPEVASRPPINRRRELMTWLIGLTAVAAVVVGVVVAMGGRVEAATWGLVVAASSLVFALYSLYRMASVLSRPAVEVVLEQDDIASLAGARELREERRRVLRAINELKFDYEMGKLSDDDYRAVRHGYEVRAVEVMRALDAQSGLHPALEEELRRRGLLDDDSSAPEPEASSEPSVPAPSSSPDHDDKPVVDDKHDKKEAEG